MMRPGIRHQLRIIMFDLAPIASIYPFAQHRLAVPGGWINYVDEGQGPVVIMLHGNPTWSFYYRRLISALSATHRVIVPDHIGCGLSDRPQGYPYRLANHIDNLAILVRHLGLKQADLVMHDWGGAIGMGYAVLELLPIRRLVFFNTAAFLSPHLPLRIGVCKIPGFGALAIRGLNGFAGGATLMAVEQPMDPQVRAGFLLPYGNWRDREATLRFVQDIPLHPFHPTWQIVDRIDKRLHLFRDTPKLFLWGAKDWCFDDDFLQGWRERFPDADFRVLPDAGHYVLEDGHAVCVPAVQQFLTV
jgi:haloalkane dehalogenase